jgi:hypothetical protein
MLCKANRASIPSLKADIQDFVHIDCCPVKSAGKMTLCNISPQVLCHQEKAWAHQTAMYTQWA